MKTLALILGIGLLVLGIVGFFKGLGLSLIPEDRRAKRSDISHKVFGGVPRKPRKEP